MGSTVNVSNGTTGFPVFVKGIVMEKDDYGMFKQRLYSHLDRHSANVTSLDKMLDVGYAGTNEFRSATAARIVLEAGSGRTRAETNAPDNTAAQRAT